MNDFTTLSTSELLSSGKVQYHKCSGILVTLEQGDFTQISTLQEELNNLQNISDYLLNHKSSERITQTKIEQFIESVKEIIQTSSQVISRYNEMIRQKREREELLVHRRDKNNEFEVRMDDNYDQKMETREKTRNSLKYSNNMADDILGSSYEVLHKLQSQNELLSRIRNNLTELGGAIGMSDQLIRTIDRRLKEDKWIVYGGMIGILILIIILYYIFVD